MTLKTVPYVPAPDIIVADLLKRAEAGPGDVLCDLGSGDGRILIKAVEDFNVSQAIGYEIRQDLYQSSLREVRQRNLQEKITIYHQDFHQAAISVASVVALYLSPDANESLRAKFEQELRAGTRVVSLAFSISQWQGDDYFYGDYQEYPEVFQADELDRFQYPIYKYLIPDAFS